MQMGRKFPKTQVNYLKWSFPIPTPCLIFHARDFDMLDQNRETSLFHPHATALQQQQQPNSND